MTEARHVSLLDTAEASSHWHPLAWRPGSLFVTGAADPIAREVAWPESLSPSESAARACAAVVQTVALHVGQSRFQMAANLGLPDGRTVRLGFDLSARPSASELTSELTSLAEQVCGAAPRRRVATPPVEPVRVRHLHLPDGTPAPPRALASELLVVTARHGSRLAIWVDVNDTISAPPWVALLADHVAAHAATAHRRHDEPLGWTCLIDEDERARLVDWSTGSTPAYNDASHLLVHERVAAQAARHPDRVAVTGAGETLTYAELLARADAVSARLAERGVGPDAIVAVYAERSVAQVVALLGILRAGGAYVAVEPSTDPPTYLATVANLAGAVAVLADHEFAEAATDTINGDDAALPPVLRLDAQVPPVGRREPSPATATGRRPEPGSTAYLSFTSGTTGEPKGVSIAHAAVLRLLDEPGILGAGAEERFLAISPIAFDASTFELWVPLAGGARVVLAPTGPLDLDEMCTVVQRERVTTMWLTAGLFHRAVDTCPQLFDGVARVLAGGDTVSAAHLRKLRERNPAVSFTNGYGPTENTTFSTWWHHDPRAMGDSVPIGLPMTGSYAQVLDDQLQLAPVGVYGELYVGGKGLARGYHARPGRTAERFVPDPFHPGERLYRTGDRARWRPDGVLEFGGRDDAQVKMRGYRIELEQIETALASMAEVVDAMVVLEKDEAGGGRLVAYVRLTAEHAAGERQATAHRVRRQLADTLPSYLVPSFVVPVVELPLTPTGKIDRVRLSQGLSASRALPDPPVEPRDDAERRLARIWADLLRVKPIGVNDSFFELGGHSLTVSVLLQHIEAEFGRSIPARTVFLSPTIAVLAEALQAAA